MTRKTLLLAAGGLGAALMACPARTTTTSLPEVSPPGARVPPGCEVDLSGEYHHAENPAFRYLATEAGGTLTLAVVRARDGVEAPADAGTAGTVSIELRRTPEGFVGETRATTLTGAGVACPVRFPTELVACDPQGLTLRSVAVLALDEDCRPAPSGAQPVWREQRLRRGAPDAGTP